MLSSPSELSSPLVERSPTPSAIRLHGPSQAAFAGRTPLIQADSPSPLRPAAAPEENFAHGTEKERQWTALRQHPYRFLLLVIAAAMSLLPLMWVGTLSASTSLGVPDAVSCQQTLWKNCGLQGESCLPFNSSSWSPVRCGPYCLAR